MNNHSLSPSRLAIEREFYGKTISFETHHLAKQSSAAVFATMEDAQVLAAITVSQSPSDRDFLPLSIDYVEKFYAAGRIPGSYPRREGKPSDHEILVSRMIDRPMRPLFPKGFRHEVQVVTTVMSMDAEQPSDVISMNAAFAALYLSEIPIDTPLAAVRVAWNEQEFLINPTQSQRLTSRLDLLVAGTATAVTMIEGNAKEVSEEIMLDAISQAHDAIKKMVAIIEEWGAGTKSPAKEFPLVTAHPPLVEKLRSLYYDQLRPLLEIKDKKEREHAFHAFVEKVKTEQTAEFEDYLHQVGNILVDLQSEILRKIILEENKRSDGRALDELRPISCAVKVLKKAHGSSLFTRGETQALSVVSLGSGKNKQRIDQIGGTVHKQFFLHYNFPPYSVGEVGRHGFVGRREVGHGMLAERSLLTVMPTETEFDYTIRVVSEILESNGSSSMATVCAGSLALMHAGVPIKRHVAGISMGLVLAEGGSNYKILTDIQGLEDHLGDMDFKVAGTKAGITGFQLDIKVQGITTAIMREALHAAKAARLDILAAMEAVIAEVGEISDHAPKFEAISIQPDKIKLLVGAGGKTIKFITEQTKSEIDIEDDGTVKIFALNHDSLEETKLMIEAAIGLPRLGTVYKGKIRRIVAFGLFIEIMPGTDGLCHISNLSHKRIANINEEYKEGQYLWTKVSSIDGSGRIALSCKDIEESEKVEKKA